MPLCDPVTIRQSPAKTYNAFADAFAVYLIHPQLPNQIWRVIIKDHIKDNGFRHISIPIQLILAFAIMKRKNQNQEEEERKRM